MKRALTVGEDSQGPRTPENPGDISQSAGWKNRGENQPALL